MADEDDGPPTSPSGSYKLFRDEAVRIARDLDEAAFVSRKRIDLYDSKRIADSERIARTLRSLAARFDRWPQLAKLDSTGKAVEAERAQFGPELVAALREGLALLRAMPTVGALGVARRPTPSRTGKP